MKDRRGKLLLLFLFFCSVCSGEEKKKIFFKEGKKEKVMMREARTVGEFIEELGIKRKPLDRVYPPLTTPLFSGMEVQVVRVEKKVFFIERKVPQRYYKFTPHLKPGEEKVVQQGKPQVIQEKWVAFFKDGVKTGAKKVAVQEVVKGTPEIVLLGKGGFVPARSRRIKRTMVMVATAYHPELCSGCDGTGLTATGHRARYGVVAVDPHVIPLYSKLYVSGYGYALALDVGGAIKGNRIDLAFESLKEVYHFGRRKVKVYILE